MGIGLSYFRVPHVGKITDVKGEYSFGVLERYKLYDDRGHEIYVSFETDPKRSDIGFGKIVVSVKPILSENRYESEIPPCIPFTVCGGVEKIYKDGHSLIQRKSKHVKLMQDNVMKILSYDKLGETLKYDILSDKISKRAFCAFNSNLKKMLGITEA